MGYDSWGVSGLARCSLGQAGSDERAKVRLWTGGAFLAVDLFSVLVVGAALRSVVPGRVGRAGYRGRAAADLPGRERGLRLPSGYPGHVWPVLDLWES